MTIYICSKLCQLIINRNMYTCSVLKAQDSHFMKKILKDTTKSKKKWQNNNINTPIPTKVAEGAHEGKRSANSKRVTVLNKLFMKYITDIMATGENSTVFLGRGIEINRVMVTPDFNQVNVFWIAKGTEDDEKVVSLLSQNAGALRHELSQLRVMGVVPKINFVKDKAYAKLIEVDLRLAKADFGEDYIPVEPSYKFKSELYLNTPLPSEVKEEIYQIEAETIEDDDWEEIPSMRMDVLGLNHADIMNRVQKSMKKTQALHRKNSEIDSINISNTINENPIQYDSYKQQREAFTQFLVKRQILRAKAKKEKEKYYPEYEYLRSELVKYYEDTPFSEELKDLKDLDYIDDQDDNKKI